MKFTMEWYLILVHDRVESPENLSWIFCQRSVLLVLIKKKNFVFHNLACSVVSNSCISNIIKFYIDWYKFHLSNILEEWVNDLWKLHHHHLWVICRKKSNLFINQRRLVSSKTFIGCRFKFLYRVILLVLTEHLL